MKFDFDTYGSAFIAMRLHRLRELMTTQFDELLLEQGIAIPSPCVSALLLLAQKRCVSITCIADVLGYSHQLINQRLAQLEALSLTKRRSDIRDRRKCMIELTARGRREARAIENILPLASRVIDQLFLEIGVDLGQGLMEATTALATESLSDRVARLDRNATPTLPKKLANQSRR